MCARLGRCRESFSYLRPKDVPQAVLKLRHNGRPESIEAQAKPETVLRYEKEVRLRSQVIANRMHLEDYDVDDIIRFGMQQFLVRADDPVESVSLYDPDLDMVERRPFPKVYHVNLVMVLTAESDPDNPSVRRVRVIFDKDGIRRLESA